MPLADRIRPRTLDDVVGQTHLIGEGKILNRIIETGTIPNMIFSGPSGIGKTTVANIIAEKTDMTLHKLNGTSAGTADIKNIVAEIGTFMGQGGILLYLDEIQYLNKKQQQSLLEYIENGDITLIASTTENPFFYIYGAILSRSTVFEFKPISPNEIIPAIKRGFSLEAKNKNIELNFENENEILHTIAIGCGGDVRKALNTVELLILTAKNGFITNELAKTLTQKSSMRYDKNGDQHYDILSAFQKSIRGSDENAAIHYLARLLAAGDLPSICRRLLVIAAEDVGLAFPQAISIVKSCVDSALQIGMPEARLPLAQAVILLATAPKSNTAHNAIISAMADIDNGISGEIPEHILSSENYSKNPKYKYPHVYKNHYVKQQYLPDAIKDKVYYEYGDNKLEQSALAYREKLIKESE